MHDASADPTRGAARGRSAGGLSRGSAALPDAWRQLLAGGMPSAVAGSALPRPPAAPALGFFLALSQCDAAPVALEAAPVHLRRDAAGEIARAEAVDPEALPEALSGAERELVCAVLALPQEARKGRAWVRLGGAGADALLGRMLAGAQCFLGGVAGLWLRAGPPLVPQWQWQLLPDGHQRLLPRRTGNQRLLRVEGLWYLDADQARLGRLQHPLARRAALPALEPAAAAALAGLLPDSALAGVVPPPRVLPPAELVDEAPQPHLTLHALARHARLATGAPPLAYARLGFDYGGVRLRQDEEQAEVRRVLDERLVRVQRRRPQELAALERCEHVGLAPVVDCEGLPWELTEVLPEDAWLFPGAGHAGALEVNTPARWLAMRGRLQAEGFHVDYDPSFPFEVVDGATPWFVRAVPARSRKSYNLRVGVRVDGRDVDLLPAASRALASGQLTLAPAAGEAGEALWYAPVDERRRVPVPLAELRALLAPIADHLERPRRRINLPWGQAGRLDELAAALPEGGVLAVPEALQGLVQGLRQAARKQQAGVPRGFAGKLRPYQRQGLSWLDALAAAGLGGILADDMGLGKTVQVLAHILALRDGGALDAPVLIVAPTSLLPNWEAEITRFAPDLGCLTVHGPHRAEALQQIEAHAVVLTSYALLPRDLDEYRRHRYALLVLDEAQQVKNPRTLARRAAAALRAARCLCLSGTPLENHLGELWSQLDLAVPGLLGSERGFRLHWRVPIEKEGNAERRAQLQQRIAPFILRRAKVDVARELPPKTSIVRPVVLEGAQRELYEALREGLYAELRESIAAQGLERSGMVVLEALLKLRQVCCDPRLIKGDPRAAKLPSAKFTVLLEMLDELLAEGRRILLFSQFTEMLELIAAALRERGIDYVELTGQTRDRATPVARFQDGEVPLFLLSLKAGGVGLNLTAADTVIHYDPWWNPAAEAQASDRAHRIGQDKPVFVYRLICVDTVEERIETLKARKAQLAASMLPRDAGAAAGFSEEDLEKLFGSA